MLVLAFVVGVVLILSPRRPDGSYAIRRIGAIIALFVVGCWIVALLGWASVEIPYRWNQFSILIRWVAESAWVLLMGLAQMALVVLFLLVVIPLQAVLSLFKCKK